MLKTRISQHSNHFNKNDLNTYLSKHYNQPQHHKHSFNIDILDHATNKTELRNKEIIWIKTLHTAFPYGLNDQIQGYGIISEGIKALDKPTHPYYQMPFPIQRNNRTRNIKKTHKKHKLNEIPTANYR